MKLTNQVSPPSVVFNPVCSSAKLMSVGLQTGGRAGSCLGNCHPKEIILYRSIKGSTYILQFRCITYLSKPLGFSDKNHLVSGRRGGGYNFKGLAISDRKILFLSQDGRLLIINLK